MRKIMEDRRILDWNKNNDDDEDDDRDDEDNDKDCNP
jgi:hypothetical protein